MPTLVYRKRGRPNAFVFGAQETPITIGRNPSCVVVVESVGVSRQHAELRTPDDGVVWEIVDLDSANGTWVNGERVSAAILRDKDSIVCGDFAMEFRRGPGTGHFHMTSPDPLGRRVSDSGPIMMPDADVSRPASRASGSYAVDEARSRSTDALPSDELEGPSEIAALRRQIAALEARNASLLDEVMLLRGTLIDSGGVQEISDEFAKESTGARRQVVSSSDLERPGLEKIEKALPVDLARMLRSAIDLDSERNAMIERLMEAVVERLAGKNGSS